MRRSPELWNDILVRCGVKPSTAFTWSKIFAAVIGDDTFSKGESEIGPFLGQILHESALLEKLEEGLYYKTQGRLMATWPSRFKTLESEKPYLCSPQALANFVYGGRMGNLEQGDGYRNRGSGLIQITGANNLRAVQAATGIPVYDNPEILRQATEGNLRVCIAWWEGHIPDGVVDSVVRVTKLVNGGTIGLADREHLTGMARKALA